MPGGIAICHVGWLVGWFVNIRSLAAMAALRLRSYFIIIIEVYLKL